ncbi:MULTISPECIES: Rieske (2Fe-2S) protein [unclassified Streptomyces]|uniref:Rieske (2Fe-2S) protein n=1 Tax=unclassified Streptomyces TaxID=2593676 RepID=UPI000DB93570|nr:MULTISPECIES: Rieske (2Fe-2S) protein [unclassified Streptomyces]MYT72778.1 Rieske 2Fe-2S domain-containing protein [Streptomyces sp. SID8367]RAJ78752.1 Rieske-like 2Fe-2S protein [Streptomyces sp. PsTaAH-137]
MNRRDASRRSVLVAGAAALAGGCSKYGDENGSGGDETRPTTASPAGSGKTPRPSPAPALAKTSDIPVGGGKVFAAEKVVVTQPAQGDFKAFSAICTHQGCTVNSVSGGTIDCPCHGSKYRIADASVAAGPAPRPLPPRRIEVRGNSITLG